MRNTPIFISINIVADATYKVPDYLQCYSAANTVSMYRTSSPKQNYTIITAEDG